MSTITNNKIKTLHGSIVALVTPMKDDNEFTVDYESLEKLIQWQISEGTQGILIMGSTGENPTVNDDEYSKILQFTVEVTKKASNNKIPVIAGTGTNCTKTTIAKTKLAQSLGVDAALVVTPFYNKPTQEGLYKHFELVSRSCEGFPIILYNVPSRTGCDILPETVARLSKLAGIIGIKEASGRPERYGCLCKLCGPNFKVFSGEDGELIDTMIHDKDAELLGVFSVTANVVPNLVQKAYTWAKNGNIEKAQALNKILLPLHAGMFCESNPIPAKFLLYHLGHIPKGIRLPLLSLSESCIEKLVNIYNKAMDEYNNFLKQ